MKEVPSRDPRRGHDFADFVTGGALKGEPKMDHRPPCPPQFVRG
jgi:hypothetical protein